ncbi:MAG: PAS domain S-box protein [Candidatus Delongbacteria bacterium]|nr:PAS domain S-box protein [Candidatus Delongbacteria bacterium]
MVRKTISIIVIEDNLADAVIIKEMLKNDQRYLVDHCIDLESAIEKIEENNYDIALVDLGLPGCAGTDAPNMLIKAKPHLPIIVLTGSDDPKLIQTLMSCGVQDYLIKGIFDKEILSRSIRYSIERQKVFRELYIQKALAENIIETAHAIVLLLDLSANILSSNRFFGEITGYQYPEIKEKNWFELFIHGDNRRNTEDIFDRCLNEEIEQGFINHVKKKNGDLIPIEWYYSVLKNEKNDLIGVLKIGHDITERKRTENEINKLSTAVDQSPSIVVMTDTSGDIIYANPIFSKITGYSFEEVKEENPRILKSGEMEDEFYNELWSTVSSGNIWSGEMINKKKDGTIYWEKAIISPVFDNDKKIINYLKIAEDVTEKKRMEYELEQHREHLEELVEQRTKELNDKNTELERINKLFFNREHRIKELKEQLKKYEK